MVLNEILYILKIVKNISWNRASRKISFVGASFRKTSSITCECSWCVRFRGMERDSCYNTDSVVITAVCGVYFNTYDPSYVDQFILARTRSGNYKKCDNQCIKEVTVQMDIKLFMSIRAIRELLSKVVPENKLY